jgi:hypothetical protein
MTGNPQQTLRPKFSINEQIVEAIWIGPATDDTIIELGVGLGSLTIPWPAGSSGSSALRSTDWSGGMKSRTPCPKRHPVYRTCW